MEMAEAARRLVQNADEFALLIIFFSMGVEAAFDQLWLVHVEINCDAGAPLSNFFTLFFEI